MSVAASRRILFGILILTLPLPMLGPFEALAPAVRYWILAGASAAVALTEGASGPVPAILALLFGHALFATGVSWGLAWVGGRALAPRSSSARGAAVLAFAVASAALAIFGSFYRTPFGRSPTAGLWGVLQ